MQVLMNSNDEELVSLKVCRICLAMDRKLYNLKDDNLGEYYQEMMGLMWAGADRLPQRVCWECARRLGAGAALRERARTSDQIMRGMLHAHAYLTIQNIKSIDRQKYNLKTTLVHKKYDNNHNDLHLHDTSPIKPESERTDGQTNRETYKDIDADLPIELNLKDLDKEDYHEIFEFDISSSSDDVVIAKHKKRKKKKPEKEIKKRSKKEPKVDKRRKPANEVLNEVLFTITDLTFDEQIAEIQKRQETSNYRNSVYKCTACFKGFLDEDAYNTHMIRHTDQSGIYKCEICKIHFKQQHALRNHATSHMQKFSCKCCPYVTTRRHAAKLHEEWHNGTRYQCPHCQEVFVKLSTYMGHIRIKHPSDFVCELCGYSFVSEKGLGLHKKLKHRFDEQPVPSDGPYCEMCEVRFVSEDALERHLKLSGRHNDDGDSKDSSVRKRARRAREPQDKCRDKRQKEQAQKKRRPAYKPEGPIPCEQCDLQLPDSLSYYRHFRRAHPDKNRTNYPSMKSKCMCEVCGKMFQSLALLQDHSWTHTDSKQFKCAQCDKCFQRKYRLIAHRRLHRGPRATHACNVCGKLFTTASNRQRHMFSHTGLKPFKCEMCGKCFKHASEKRAHITYVHLKKPWPKRARSKRRQGQLQPQQSVSGNNDVDIVQPLWPACNDPKIGDILMDDKPMYYNLKI